MKNFKSVTLIIIFLSFFFHAFPATPIMKVSEIKPGMEGQGRTIFKGSKIETFDFKVLGVIEKFVPDKDLIIIECDNPVLAETGIIAGMSGSPAYIDGKLIGAVAYGFAFSKRPIGGITPIEDILKTAEYNKTSASSTIDLSTIKLEFDKKNISRIATMVYKELTHRFNGSSNMNSGIIPIKLAGAQRGFKPEAAAPLNALFSPVNSLKFKSGQFTSKIDPSKSAEMLKILPADAASIPLIKGDFEYSSVGTVTHVDGDKIYLFGHPFFNLGPVDFPLHKADVISVVPSYQSSFKLAATRQMVGRVKQDRFSAVQGELGKLPYMIPMKVFLRNRNHTFNLELVSHSLLTPALSAISMINIFTTEYQQFGFQSLQVRGKIFIEGEQNILIDDLYTGIDPFNDFGNLLLVVNYFLMNNPEKSVKIQKYDFEVTASERVRRANIENVLVSGRSFLPGEMIDVVMFLRNEKGLAFNEAVTLKTPNLKAGSEFYLLVADNQEMARFDSRNVKSNYFPMKVNSLIRAINNLRKNNRVYIKVMAPSQGLFVKGYEYSNLPSSMRNVFMYNSSPVLGTENTHSQVKFSTIREYQVEIPAVVRGKKLFKLKIKERSDVK